MKRIEPIPNTELTQYVVKLLNASKICTILDILQEDSTKLMKITNLPLKNILNIKKYLIRENCIQPCNGLEYLRRFTKNYLFLATGIKSLDEMLDGGFISGNIIEICGLPASGKTFLCTSIAMNISKLPNTEVLYVDTKHDFSGYRLERMLAFQNCSQTTIGTIMQRIKVKRISSVLDFIQILEALIDNWNDENLNFRAIIVDSLPSIWFLYNGLEIIEGKCALVDAANMMRKLANERNIVIIIVNIVTRWSDMDLDEIDMTKCHTITKPSLGKYWLTVPSTRLLISDLNTENFSQTACIDNTANCSERTLKIIKSDFYECEMSCTVHITNQGIV